MGLGREVRSWVLLLASVGLRRLKGEERRSQCLVGPSEGGVSLYVSLLHTRQSWRGEGTSLDFSLFSIFLLVLLSPD